jgi:hypothetical protein
MKETDFQVGQAHFMVGRKIFFLIRKFEKEDVLPRIPNLLHRSTKAPMMHGME